MSKKTEKNQNLPWHTVEKKINEEINWLRQVLDIHDQEKTLPMPGEMHKYASNYYLYRLIAILIVNGQIKAREINSDNLWGRNNNKYINKIHRHGKEWHAKMMDIIDNYFKSQDYNITTEPHTHYGRADLGVFKKDKKDLYIEVGTISLYKLCVNLHFMKNVVFLLVSSENKVIEFEK